LPLLLNELAAEPRPAILVLDDYQAVTNPDGTVASAATASKQRDCRV
jgi:ATP/maltotriose-dependent transcriptional regulator MalT